MTPKTERSHCHQIYTTGILQEILQAEEFDIISVWYQMETWIYTKTQKVSEMVKRNSYKSIFWSQLQTYLQFTYQGSLQDSLLIASNSKPLSHELCLGLQSALNHLNLEPKLCNYPTSDFPLLRYC